MVNGSDMRYRTTATHDIEGTVVLSEPIGLRGSILGLVRHPELHSLVKEFNTSMQTYGSNGTQDGKRNWFKNIEKVHGPDSVVLISFEEAKDGFNFVSFFSGEVAIQSIVESLGFDHVLEFTPAPNGFWRRFMSRFDVPVNVQSATDLDGGAVDVLTPETLNLPSQKLRRIFERDIHYNDANLGLFDPGEGTVGLTSWVTFTNSYNIIDEIGQRFDYGNAVFTTLPTDVFEYFFKMEYAGRYRFQANLKFSVILSGPRVITLQWYYATRLSGVLTETAIGGTWGGGAPTNSIKMSGVLTPDITIDMEVGDEFYLYAKITLDSGADISFFSDYDDDSGLPFDPVYTEFKVTADTIFQDSQTNGKLLHDLCASVSDRITDTGKFYSDLLGSPYTQARTYAESGCYWNNIVLTGLLLRGYTLSEKQFAISMKNIWDGINPHLNLYMGYEKHPDTGVDIIRLEEKAHGYDSSSFSVLLSGVQKIRRKYTDQYFNSVETGSQKGAIEDISGIDDPQKQTRASIFKNIGKKLSILSTWITQGLTIEWTRRSTKKKSADNKFDNDYFMIEVTRDGSEYNPRIDEDYDSVTNLLNEDTRYNKRWTPARMFLRWSNYIFNGCQNYIGTVYRFVSGEGNYDMTSERVPDDCSDNYGGEVLAENADITVTSEHLYIPIEYEIEHYLTQEEFDTIDANRTLALGVSQFAESLGGHVAFFINDLKLEKDSGQIKISGFFKDYFDIQTVPQGGTITQGGKIFDATFDVSFE